MKDQILTSFNFTIAIDKKGKHQVKGIYYSDFKTKEKIERIFNKAHREIEREFNR